MKQASPTGDSILIDTLNTDKPRDKWGSGYFYGQRKPDLYGIIVSPIPEKQLITHDVNVPYEQLQQKYLSLESALSSLRAKYDALFSVLSK